MISFRSAANLLLLVLALALAFQVVVLAGHIPTEMVWGGRLANEQERTVGALVSITVLLLMITIVRVRRSNKGGRLAMVARYGVWAIAVVFALNTVGNVFALDVREALIFTPVTLVCSLLACRVALGEP